MIHYHRYPNIDINLKLESLFSSLIFLLSKAFCFHQNKVMIDDGHILHIQDKTFGMTIIYASTNYVTRRLLLNYLSNTQATKGIPWCFIRDFNTILGGSGIL